MWGYFWLVVVILLVAWAGWRTKGRGNRPSGGAGDHPTGKYY